MLEGSAHSPPAGRSVVRDQGRVPGTEDRGLDKDLTLGGVVPQAGTLDAVTAQESQRWLDSLAGPISWALAAPMGATRTQAC